MTKPSIVKIRVRGDVEDVTAVCDELGRRFDVARDSGNLPRGQVGNTFFDRYLEIVFNGRVIINSDTGEILD